MRDLDEPIMPAPLPALYAMIASISALTPTMFITRVRL